MYQFDGIKNRPETPRTLPPQPSRKKRRWKWVFLAVLLALVAAIIWGGSGLLSKTNKIFANKENIFVRVGRLLISEDKPLKGEDSGAVNILLLGMGGPGHEGPLLTDTMIVASINPATSEVNLISIPRDFMIKLDSRGYNKINAAYAYAELDQPGSGGQAAIKVAEQVTGLAIPYFAAVDFKGFVSAVDYVDGLDITIDRTFTDSSYPDYNNCYMAPQTFTKGTEHMDGERALIFARSRKGNNGEGSDFARSERQKKIMLGMKEKILALNITELSTINNLLSAFTENFRTNFEPYEIKRLSQLGFKITGDNVYSLSLEPQAGIICDAMVDLATGRPAPAPVQVETVPDDETGDENAGNPDQTTEEPKAVEPAIVRAYVVTACSGKTSADIHNFLTEALQWSRLQSETASLEIQNTTGTAAALNPWRDLANSSLEVKFTTGKTPYQRTILYDNTRGGKPKTLDYLKANYSFDVADLPYPQSQADFVIIVGTDSTQ